MTLESYMNLAETIAREMDDGLLPLEDLIAEAYLGLSEALDELGEAPDEDLLDDAIRDHLHRVIAETQLAYDSDLQLISRVETLSASIDKLTEELGTKPNLDELANDLGMTQDEVIAVLKLTGENVDA